MNLYSNHLLLILPLIAYRALIAYRLGLSLIVYRHSYIAVGARRPGERLGLAPLPAVVRRRAGSASPALGFLGVAALGVLTAAVRARRLALAAISVAVAMPLPAAATAPASDGGGGSSVAPRVAGDGGALRRFGSCSVGAPEPSGEGGGPRATGREREIPAALRKSATQAPPGSFQLDCWVTRLR